LAESTKRWPRRNPTNEQFWSIVTTEASREIGGYAAVNDIQHEDGFPLLPFGRMNRREDQIVLIQHRHPCLIARGIRRVERQLGQEASPRWITCGNFLEPQQVGLANGRIFMKAFEMRLIPATCMADLGGPAGIARTNGLERSHERIPAITRPRRCRDIGQSSQRIGSIGHDVEDALRRRRSHARQQLHDTKARDPVAGGSR
jgi:hypothetical protein